MRTKLALLISSFGLLFGLNAAAQSVSAVYKANDLFKRMDSKDTLYILNFWATWCKPCMEELKSIDTVGFEHKGTAVKLIFVNLDFIEKKERVNQILVQKGISSECVLLDEVNGNEYIDNVSEKWSGEIPATLLKIGIKKELLNKKMSAAQLRAALVNFSKN